MLWRQERTVGEDRVRPATPLHTAIVFERLNIIWSARCKSFWSRARRWNKRKQNENRTTKNERKTKIKKTMTSKNRNQLILPQGNPIYRDRKKTYSPMRCRRSRARISQSTITRWARYASRRFACFCLPLGVADTVRSLNSKKRHWRMLSSTSTVKSLLKKTKMNSQTVNI